jgi:RND family efflux transporter MFP subunit
VKLAVVSRGEVGSSIALTGSIEPFRQVGIVPQISGKIDAIWVKEGDTVRRGEKLARLETKTAELQLAQAKANVAAAEAGFNAASKDLDRMRALHDQESISPQALEKVQLAYEAAKAQLEQANAARDLAQHQMDISTMKAPFDGIIAGKYLNEGEMINPGMPGEKGVVTLMDISKVKVHVNVSEADIEKVRVGQPVQVAVGASFDRGYTGVVSSINLAADPLSRSFRAEITVPNENRQLKAGMYARVKLFTEMRKDVLVVPEKAVVAEKAQAVAYIVDRNKARRREVVIGIVSDGQTEIRSGLAEGDSVVVEGNYGLFDGAPVKW